MDLINLALATDGGVTLGNLVSGVPNVLKTYVGPITIAVGIIAVIIGVIQLVRYITSKSNGGGQGRVSIVFAIILIIFGGACAWGGSQFAKQLSSGGQNTIEDISNNGNGGSGAKAGDVAKGWD